MVICYPRNRYGSTEVLEVMSLLGSLPQLVHPGLHLVSVRFGALRPPDVGVRIEHLASARPVRIWIGVNVAVGVGRRWHTVRRGRLPSHTTHVRAPVRASGWSLLHTCRRLEDRGWSVASRMGGWSHAIREGSCRWCLLVSSVVLASKMTRQGAVIHEAIVTWVAMRIVHGGKLGTRGCSGMPLSWGRR
jgi:hypothetical protein